MFTPKRSFLSVGWWASVFRHDHITLPRLIKTKTFFSSLLMSLHFLLIKCSSGLSTYSWLLSSHLNLKLHLLVFSVFVVAFIFSPSNHVRHLELYCSLKCMIEMNVPYLISLQMLIDSYSRNNTTVKMELALNAYGAFITLRILTSHSFRMTCDLWIILVFRWHHSAFWFFTAKAHHIYIFRRLVFPKCWTAKILYLNVAGCFSFLAAGALLYNVCY